MLLAKKNRASQKKSSVDFYSQDSPLKASIDFYDQTIPPKKPADAYRQILDPNGDLILVVSPPSPTPKANSGDAGSHDKTAPSNTLSVSHQKRAIGMGTSNTAKARFLVSAQHLRLASGYFARRLRDFTIQPGEEPSEMPVSATNLEALRILLYAIHGHFRQVPRSLSFDLLLAISILVERFECHENVELFADMWLDGYRNGLFERLLAFTPELMEWILISWVFKERDIFQFATQIAQLHSAGLIDWMSLPVPRSIKGRLFNLHVRFLCAFPYVLTED